VEWRINQLVNKHKGIFHEFQFGKPNSTCISAIILKTLTIHAINVANTPAVIHDIDTTKAFDLVINGIALLALSIIGFQESMTTIVKLPQHQPRTRTDIQTCQRTLRATQVRVALSYTYAVTYQNRIIP
jgi:succinate dehydrogenase hydrophobic anchor subunit